ncbi:MAG: 30S ribosomal protein S12 methylthiotransferase RimO [Candidatus Aminicenantes bacterium]|nr:30S ribosomal protein S12 methylthiotransferase RimO [Candidatus Aminicenantes bacterium]
MKNVALVSLGCAKNLVDSEVMLGALRQAGYGLLADPKAADVVIVNTCGFIQPARAEAEAELRAAVEVKRKRPETTVVAAGCYVERDRARLQVLFPEVDIWTGVREFDRIAALVAGRRRPERERTFLYGDLTPRVVSTPPGWAYVKISEGCSHRCAFCAIPSIKGRYRSRSVASIVREVEGLVARGVKEVNLISQDSTFFGRDAGRRDGLASLLERLLEVRGLAWIRVLYGYPEEVTDRLLELLQEPRVCPYLDIPFQHADPGVIKTMRRGLDGARALRLLERIRRRVPDVAVRTALIVGFPGEGRPEFARLKRFVAEAHFDHLGVFPYSLEPGTPAFGLGDPVPEEEKQRRRNEIMEMQVAISLARNKARVGRTLDVLFECDLGGRPRTLAGRTRYQAPEVDGVVLVKVKGAGPGALHSIREVTITSANVYDLHGKLAPSLPRA